MPLNYQHIKKYMRMVLIGQLDGYYLMQLLAIIQRRGIALIHPSRQLAKLYVSQDMGLIIMTILILQMVVD